ncbi:MAG TPA: DUF5710 domain-containing protein [Holophaga sp.]|nr:DUF5710 domain-containing protein [Holophaga sp.]
MPTPLQVPYAEKDQAKALGAKWNPAEKVWFVPDGVEVAPFQKWLPKPQASAPPAGKPSPSKPEPGWLTLARCLGRGPLVLLHANECWKCHKEGLAVVLAFPPGDEDRAALEAAEALWNQGVDPSDEDADWLSLDSQMAVACGEGTVGLLSGGEVAHPLVLDQARAFSRTLPLKVATFKERYSKTVQDRYLSQGCPHCDALWGDFPLSETAFEYLERIEARDFGRDGLFAFQLQIPAQA